MKEEAWGGEEGLVLTRPGFRRVRKRVPPALLSTLPTLGLAVGTAPTTMPSWEARLGGVVPGKTDMKEKKFMSVQVHIFVFSVLHATHVVVGVRRW